MTGPEHYLDAERLMAEANEWLDADYGWKANMPTEERLARRSADLAYAQVHATLALAAATALVDTTGPSADPDFAAWVSAASAYKPPVKLNGGQS